MSLSMVLTCCNEVPLIFECYQAVSALLTVGKIEHDFIVVDDGSIDEVQRALESFFDGSRAQLILCRKNEGRGLAVTKGFRSAHKEYVGFIDTDLEIPAHVVPVLYYTALTERADVVIAERVPRWDLNVKHMIRNLGSRGLRFASSLMLGLGNLDTGSGAKIFRRDAVMALLGVVSNTCWFWDTEIVAEALKCGLRVVQVPVVMTRRGDKASTVRLLGDTLSLFKALFAYRRKMKRQGMDGC